MAFNIVTSEIELPYRFNHSYFEHGNDLRKQGNPEIGFSDADIVEITNFAKGGDRREISFHKERLYPKPDEIVFTIFDVEETLIISELHVILSEKRSYWRKNRPGKVYADMSVRLKITQDPNCTTYIWTGHYS